MYVCECMFVLNSSSLNIVICSLRQFFPARYGHRKVDSVQRPLQDQGVEKEGMVGMEEIHSQT